MRDTLQPFVNSIGPSSAPRRGILGCRPVWLLLLLVPASLLARAPTYWTPGRSDLRLFAYFGARWRQGAVPYLDIWDNKPPGIFALMSVLMPAPASDTLWLALTESLFVAVTALLIYALLRRLGLAETWRIAGVGFFVLLNTLAIYADGGGYTELFTLAPSVASVLLWLRGKSEEKAAWLVLAGASTGLGTLFKLPAIAPLLAFLTFSALECITRSKPIGLCLRQSTQLLTGFALPWSITGAYFMYHGAAAELLRVSFLHPFAYGYSSLSTRLGLAGVARRLYYVLWPLAPLIPPVVIGVPWSILC